MYDQIIEEDDDFLANYSDRIDKNEFTQRILPENFSFSNQTSQNPPKSCVCVEENLYIANNAGWVPEHIAIGSRQVYCFLAIYMTLLFTLSCILNGIVAAATIKYKQLRQPLNYVIVNLATTDLLAGIIEGPLAIPANAYGYYFWGEFLCYFQGYVVSVFSCTGLNTIAVMAFERFFVVCKPFGNVPFGHKAASAGLAIAWVWSVIWNTIPLIFWNGYQPEGFGTTCAPNWFTTEHGPRMFLLFYFAFCFLLPLGVIVICYGALIINLRKIAKQSTVSGSKSPENEVAKMVVLMVSAFLVAWLPYAIFCLYNIAHPGAQIGYDLSAIPAFFAKSATLYNPLIYIGFNRQFRDFVIKMFCNGKNPWSDEIGGSVMSSQVASQVTTVGSNKVAPA